MRYQALGKVLDKQDLHFVAFMIWCASERMDEWNKHSEHPEFDLALGRLHRKLENAFVLAEEDC